MGQAAEVGADPAVRDAYLDAAWGAAFTSIIRTIMADVIDFAPGGYRYVKGTFMYSAGVAAERGFRMERVRFGNVLPVAEGFRQRRYDP